MWLRVLITYVFGVGVIGGTAYTMFDWFPLAGLLWLALFSAIAGGISLFILNLTGRLGGGGGGGTASATYQSKGARGGDER